MEEVKRFVGIDVAKAALDVFIGSDGAAFSVTNDEVGIRELLGQLKPTDFVILEATGGLETPVASALAAAGIAVAIVNPRQVRDFARATGRLAKTDALDAEVLARFGEAGPTTGAARGRRTGAGTRSTGYPSAPVGRDADRREESPGQRPKGFAP